MTAVGSTGSGPLRIAVFSHGTEAPPAARAYREELELFTAAEGLGYDGAWIRQFHFRGEPLGDGDARLDPDGSALLDRVWDATLTAESAAVAAHRGHGVLVGTTQTVPAEVTAAAYHDALHAGTAPRVALSTAIHPAADRDTALREARAGIEAKYAWGASFLPPATTLAEQADALNLHHGTADDIVESILSKPYSRYATQLNVQVEHGYTDLGRRIDALALFAEEVAPRIGATLDSTEAAGATTGTTTPTRTEVTA